MDHAAKGATALAASDAETAITAYTKALIEHPTSPDYYVQRSIAFARLKPQRWDLALKDAEYAVLSAQKRQSREKIQKAQHRRVVALYGLAQYSNAKFLLEKMERWRGEKDKAEGSMWMAKIERKLKEQGAEPVTVSEYPGQKLPDDNTLKAELQHQLSDKGVFNFGETSGAEKVNTNNTTSSATTNGSEHTMDASSTDVVPSETGAVSKIRDEWYQNAESVSVSLYAKGVPKDAANIEIKEDSVFVSFPHPSNPSSTFTFTVDPLFALIDPATSTSRVLSTKVELTLSKKAKGHKWSTLEGTQRLRTTIDEKVDAATKLAMMSHLRWQPKSTVQNDNKPPSYPTSSKTGPKNWDKVASDLTAKKPKKTKQSKKESKPDSTVDGAADSSEHTSDNEEDEYDSDFESGDKVDGFFKKLYKGADDDTRRAMMKSMYESQGTSLSTNWAEVGSKKMEPVKSKDDD